MSLTDLQGTNGCFFSGRSQLQTLYEPLMDCILLNYTNSDLPLCAGYASLTYRLDVEKSVRFISSSTASLVQRRWPGGRRCEKVSKVDTSAGCSV